MKTINTLFYFLIVFLSIPTSSHARHLIGGEMTYKCLGDGDYEINLSIYRDCSSNEAALDPAVPITIQQCNEVESINCNFLIRTVFQVALTATESVEEFPVVPCFTSPPNSCVERGIYQFKLSDYGISLPNDGHTYKIVTQRCCRNELVTNIETPEKFGNSFSVELTPLAQESCNSSPTFFKNFYFILCRGLNMAVPFTATDIDGDSLVYSFTPLVNGGGDITTFPEISSCFGAIPNPVCPPPFLEIPFKNGFSHQIPFGESDTTISINPATGIMTGIPSNLGQYAYAVTVSEYRNGDFLSTTRLESQMNIINCPIQDMDSNECIFPTSTIDLEVDATFDINPNPVTDYFTIQSNLPSNTRYTLSLFSIQGNLLVNHTLSNSSASISMQQFEKGMYLVLIRTESATYFKKIVK